jgi:hypothetical protein
MNGKTTMVMTVDPQIREFMGLIPRELIAFRCRTIKGRRILIGEKVPLHSIANPGVNVADVVPGEGG